MTNKTELLFSRDETWASRDVMPGRGFMRPQLYKQTERLTVTDDAVIVSRHQHLKGVSKSNKVFFRTETPNMVVVKAKKTKAGETRINIYSTVVKRYRHHPSVRDVRCITHSVDLTWRALGQGNKVLDAVAEFIEQHTGRPVERRSGSGIVASILPGIKLWHQPTPYEGRGPDFNINLITDGLRHDNIHNIVKALYGVTNYRRDLVKAVASARLDYINMLYVFKGIVPIDWMIEALNASPRRDDRNVHAATSLNRESARNFRRVVKQMSGPRRRALILGLARGETNRMLISDTFSAFKQRVDVNDETRAARTFRELHDAVYNMRRAQGHYYAAPVQEVKPIKIKKTAIAKAVEALEIEGLRFVCPETSELMQEWGNYMHNCIGSYAYSAKSGAGVYVGVYQGDTLVANLELKPTSETNFDLRQILGKYNRDLDKDLYDQIVLGLLSIGMNEKTEKSAWGYIAHNFAGNPTLVQQAYVQPYQHNIEINAQILQNRWLNA